MDELLQFFKSELKDRKYSADAISRYVNLWNGSDGKIICPLCYLDSSEIHQLIPLNEDNNVEPIKCRNCSEVFEKMVIK